MTDQQSDSRIARAITSPNTIILVIFMCLLIRLLVLLFS